MRTGKWYIYRYRQFSYTQNNIWNQYTIKKARKTKIKATYNPLNLKNKMSRSQNRSEAPSIQLFGSPNGLCSSITESKHIKAVKEPWRRSNRYKALKQMLRTILRTEKLAALHQRVTTMMAMMKKMRRTMAGLLMMWHQTHCQISSWLPEYVHISILWAI